MCSRFDLSFCVGLPGKAGRPGRSWDSSRQSGVQRTASTGSSEIAGALHHGAGGMRTWLWREVILSYIPIPGPIPVPLEGGEGGKAIARFYLARMEMNPGRIYHTHLSVFCGLRRPASLLVIPLSFIGPILEARPGQGRVRTLGRDPGPDLGVRADLHVAEDAHQGLCVCIRVLVLLCIVLNTMLRYEQLEKSSIAHGSCLITAVSLICAVDNTAKFFCTVSS